MPYDTAVEAATKRMLTYAGVYDMAGEAATKRMLTYAGVYSRLSIQHS
jgi:hypothetical protein